MEITNRNRQILKALGADTRLDILKKLNDRQMTASELSKYLGKHVTTMSQHLDMLVEMGLVKRLERPGRKWVYYKLTNEGERITRPTESGIIFRLFASSMVLVFGSLILLQSAAVPEYLTERALAVPVADTSIAQNIATQYPYDYYIATAALVIIAFLILSNRKVRPSI